ncbi:glycosyltransferase family 2 protein [Methylomonas rosea]|uniref:Glycosyltransferase family 2 protein n=1 Tax=Methylomonas rosea TaxID=2952227 RepID=A0ABT1TTX6_9GAMM|nr:glycosyltransferase family 2 protein [Methylomonas sp. WSC-7]MCQ8118228.1 glycosyltransferase family 2 protein [Methylomonas sp. WSC-7]
MKNLFIVITDFNGYAQTQRCLQALAASQYRTFTVLLVDHGTTDITRIGLARDFPDVICLEGSSELWWTGATNLGIRAAIEHGADYVMLLNNDCYVAPDTAGHLVQLTEAYPKAIIAPVQRDWQTGQITSISPSTCFLLGFSTIAGPKQFSADMLTRDILPVKLIVGGRGTLIPVAVFNKIGLLDEKRLPHYGADHDFYLRAGKQKISLNVAPHVFVNIDAHRTSQASNPARLSLLGFMQSLTSVSSHRNIRDVVTLFEIHYPFSGLYKLGVALYFMRYFIVYLFNRARCVI